MRRGLVVMALAASLVAGVGVGATPAAAASHGPSPMTQCGLPASGGNVGNATPGQEDLNPVAVASAIEYANTHLRASVQIFRNNCKVAEGLLDPVTDSIPYEVFSSTKSVVSILTGVAYDQHRLSLDDPIGKYLPTGPGWGDAAHRAITIRQLLTETAGLRESILTEFASVGVDPNIVQEALAQPLISKPGTTFDYTQRVPDLLAFVVQRAVGEDLQAFAQQYVFSPIGIPANSYIWLRDRSGNTYGYANLFIPPTQFAKLGLLMQNGGNWNGRQVLSTNYIGQLRQPTATNGCYGFLFWVNGGSSCKSANIPAAQTVDHEMIPSAPPDLFAMVGALQQNNFMVPSLNMTVTWTGILGDTTPNLAGLLSASGAASDLYYNFFRILMAGVEDRHVPDPGPYVSPPEDFDINPINYLDPSVLLTDLVTNPSCNVLFCDGTIPTTGLVQNGQAVTRYLAGLGAPG
ncbi:MAG TPA: serine hydrolase [Acidimicrobiales bacterium]|jgi:CubicO group peptidase (beta-lactamase class C family)|nr:serine hydrolase [Acidimicrobiales bacterium]